MPFKISIPNQQFVIIPGYGKVRHGTYFAEKIHPFESFFVFVPDEVQEEKQIAEIETLPEISEHVLEEKVDKNSEVEAVENEKIEDKSTEITDEIKVKKASGRPKGK